MIKAGASTRFTSTSTSTSMSTCNMCEHEYEYEYLIITWVRVRVLVDEYEYKYGYRSIINILYSMYRQQIFSCDQLYEWFSPSVRLSVHPSVTPFWLCSHHRIIMKFSGVITNDKSDVHAKDQGRRSTVKVTEVMTQFSRFLAVLL